jgi:hypothetical protein
LAYEPTVVTPVPVFAALKAALACKKAELENFNKSVP